MTERQNRGQQRSRILKNGSWDVWAAWDRQLRHLEADFAAMPDSRLLEELEDAGGIALAYAAEEADRRGIAG